MSMTIKATMNCIRVPIVLVWRPVVEADPEAQDKLQLVEVAYQL